MKYKWVRTPGGIKRVVICVSLFIGGGLLFDAGIDWLANLLFIIGFSLMVHGYMKTYQNIKRHNHEVEDTQELVNKLNDNWVSEEEKRNIKRLLKTKG